MTTILDDTKHSIIISNIEPKDYNMTFIKQLMLDTKTNLQNIQKTKLFKANKCMITFTTEFARNEFMYENRNIYNTHSKYKNIFIHNYLTPDTIKHGQLLYHATKTKYIIDYRKIFNRKTNTFELRKLVNNIIDWTTPAYKLSELQLDELKKTYSEHINTFKTTTPT